MQFDMLMESIPEELYSFCRNCTDFIVQRTYTRMVYIHQNGKPSNLSDHQRLIIDVHLFEEFIIIKHVAVSEMFS